MSPGDTNPTLDSIIADYLRVLDAGDPPDRNSLLNEHPDLADDLNSFFANHDRLAEVLSDEVRKLVEEGRKLDAVKLHKEETEVTLMEAKRAVEASMKPGSR